MIKKVKVEQLGPGMFIHDFNCGWIKHPFLSNSIKIADEKTIEKIIDYGIREVYIDTDKGNDVAGAPTEEEVSREIQAQLNKVVEPEINDRDVVPVQEEIARAKEIKKEALQTVRDLMEDVRFGKQIKMEKVNHITEKMVDSILRNKGALTSLSRIKQADEYTFMHSISVGVLMIAFGRSLGFDYKLIKALGAGGLLHDIGKIKVPAGILAKTTQLSEDEFVSAKEHVKHSRVILEHTRDVNETSVLMAIHHHERMDGSGYPGKLKGDEISKFGQMSAIADVYDAMTSKRCYQRKFEPTEVLKKLFEWSRFYSNELVQQFIRCVGIYPVGSLVRLESGLLGVVLNLGEKSLLHPVVRIVYNTKKEKYISPYDIDLAQNNEDSVASSELPDKWNITPGAYL
ncbi:cyclic di-GMP phosphodiesterase response regulator RpfG [bacterium BMS3Bbin05]|nr:cyclic di-GMP phosphodiesterase response regulator RpfG [bacterium BMS3Bbin05]HDH05855.1 HD-GYP domain-containing protein [Nitrospirota bacterium]